MQGGAQSFLARTMSSHWGRVPLALSKGQQGGQVLPRPIAPDIRPQFPSLEQTMEPTTVRQYCCGIYFRYDSFN
jgi:hypothetical protein